MAACDVCRTCLKQPTTNLTIVEGDSFTMSGGWWRVEALLFSFCEPTSATMAGQFRPSGGAWTNMTTTTALKTANPNPDTLESCAESDCLAIPACSSCTSDQMSITVTANVGSGSPGGTTYEISFLATSDATGNAVRSGILTITVQSKVKGSALPLLGVG